MRAGSRRRQLPYSRFWSHMTTTITTAMTRHTYPPRVPANVPLCEPDEHLSTQSPQLWHSSPPIPPERWSRQRSYSLQQHLLRKYMPRPSTTTGAETMIVTRGQGQKRLPHLRFHYSTCEIYPISNRFVFPNPNHRVLAIYRRLDHLHC